MLYIHIPFCNSKCFYCAFNSYTTKHHLKDCYFDALKTQFENEKVEKKFNSVFIGGGTPSVMDLHFYEKLFNLISPHLKKECEITIEVNPNSVKERWLAGIKEFGVNRISFGVQSFDDEKLKFLGRSHSAREAIFAIEKAKKFFDNINIDLIYSTKLDTKRLLENDLKMALKLKISHLSAYSLTIEKGTKFYETPENRKENEELEIFFIEKIREHFIQYEISNFSLNFERICQHNLGYWQLKNYLGLGAGAVSFDGKSRYYTHALPENYINSPTFKKIENLTQFDLKVEKTFLGLRSIVGVELKIFNEKERKKIFELIDAKKLFLRDDKIFSDNFLLADALTSYILF